MTLKCEHTANEHFNHVDTFHTCHMFGDCTEFKLNIAHFLFLNWNSNNSETVIKKRRKWKKNIWNFQNLYSDSELLRQTKSFFHFSEKNRSFKIFIYSMKWNPQNRKPLKWLFRVKFKMGVSNHNVVLSKIDSKYISRRQISLYYSEKRK